MMISTSDRPPAIAKDTMRIFVATDQRMGKSDVALMQSIAENCSPPYQLTFMRAGTPGWVVGQGDLAQWQIGRPAGLPYSQKGWATDFTCFRFAVPALCKFEGRAIYLDTDFIVLKDLRELWESVMSKAVMSPSLRTDIMLMDCEQFYDNDWLISEMQESGKSIDHYRNSLIRSDRIEELHPHWESWDGVAFTDKTRTIHFTNMRTQPWKPYPEVFQYPPHRSPEAVELWQGFYERGATAAMHRVQKLYDRYSSTPSNIAHYMPLLRDLASQCDVVCEFGVERGRSSSALLMGAREHVHSWDVYLTPEADGLYQVCPHKWTLNLGNSEEAVIPECDMLFIDSSHNGDCLRAELRNAHRVRKFIAMHDTTVCADYGTVNVPGKSVGGYEGLAGPIKEFLESNPNWTKHLVLDDVPGLTVLKRKEGA